MCIFCDLLLRQSEAILYHYLGKALFIWEYSLLKTVIRNLCSQRLYKLNNMFVNNSKTINILEFPSSHVGTHQRSLIGKQ